MTAARFVSRGEFQTAPKVLVTVPGTPESPGLLAVATSPIIMQNAVRLEVSVRRNPFSFVVLLLVFFIAVLPPSFADPPQRHQAPPLDQSQTPQEQQRSQIEKEMEKKANQERQAQLKRDAAKLFRLSTELKDYVDKTNENVLSVEVLKKAEEIEKLARSVKEKMKGNN